MANLRSDTFYFMRTKAVDLSRYLPLFLYKDDYFADVQNALNIEHERYRLKLAKIAANFFIETADNEGIQDFERLLKITPRYPDDWNLRRTVARVKLRGGNVLTLENTRRLLQEFTEHGGIAGVEEPGENRLKFTVQNGNFIWEELLPELWRQLPAHLVFDFGINWDFGEQTVHIAQPVAVADRGFFDLSLENPAPMFVVPNIIPVDISTDSFDIGTDDTTFSDNISLAQYFLESEHVEFAADDEVDSFSYALWTMYLKRFWRKFNLNPVVNHYYDEEDIIDDDDDWDETEMSGNFIKLYFNFHKSDESRLIVMNFARDDISAAEINSFPADGVLRSRRGYLSDKVYRAVYVTKTITKIDV